MADRARGHGLVALGREHGREVEGAARGRTEHGAVLRHDRLGGEALVEDLAGASAEALAQLRVRDQLVEPGDEGVHVADGDDESAGAVLDRVPRPELVVVGDGGQSVVGGLEERVPEPLGQRGHQHDVGAGVDVLLGAEAWNRDPVPQPERIDQLVHRDEVGVQRADVAPQGQVHRVVLEPRQGPDRLELVLAVLERGRQHDLDAGPGLAHHLRGMVDVGDAHHVRGVEARGELLVQPLGDGLDPVDHLPRLVHQRPELVVVAVVAVHLQQGAGAPLLAGEGAMEGESLQRGREDHGVLGRELLVELAQGRELVGGVGVARRVDASGEDGMDVLGEQAAALGGQRLEHVGGDLGVERPARHRELGAVPRPQEAQDRQRVSPTMQGVRGLDHGLVVAGGAGQLVDADQDHGPRSLSTGSVQIRFLRSAASAPVTKCTAALGTDSRSWPRSTCHTARTARVRSEECESSCAAR